MRAVIPATGLVVLASAATLFEPATTHNAGHQRALDCQCLFASVPRFRGVSHRESGDFRVEFDEGGRLKTLGGSAEKVGSGKC